MDLRQLASFVAVVETGGFSRAADDLGITQPAVSAHVARLERELGTMLFERGGPRGARPTDAARAAVAAARTALRGPELVRSAVAEHTGLLTGSLALGHVGSGAAGSLLEPLVAFRAAHPGVEVSLVEQPSADLVGGVVDGRLDLAWVAAADALPEVLATDEVLDEPVVAAAAPGAGAWRRRTSCDLGELAGHDVIALPQGNGARTALDRACRDAGLHLRIALECSSPDLVRELVLRGLGVAVLSRPVALHLGLHAVPIADLRSRLLLTWRRDRPDTPAAAAFRAFLHPAGAPRPRARQSGRPRRVEHRG